MPPLRTADVHCSPIFAWKYQQVFGVALQLVILLGGIPQGD